jgi:D-3-phosphoglycerate dehydrogenase
MSPCRTTPAIVVTPRALSTGSHPSLDALRRAGFELRFPAPGRRPEREELLASVPGCIGYLAGTEVIDDELLSASAPGLRVIARNGVGVDSIDLSAAQKHSVSVVPAPGANAQGVAELAIALMLALARRIPWHSNGVAAGEWERSIGIEISGRTLGVIGCGQIGQRVSTAALALGMTVLGFDAYPQREFVPDGFRWADRNEVVAGSDVLTLHVPASADDPIVDARCLEMVQRGALLINTARASLVDLDTVLHALERGQLGGFATDVYPVEPPLPHPLWAHESVIATPHLGGYTMESIDRAAHAAVNNLLHELGSH